MKKQTTQELINRLKRIEIEKWNLGVESTQIMEELWRRVDAFDVKEKPKELVKEVKDENSNKRI